MHLRRKRRPAAAFGIISREEGGRQVKTTDHRQSGCLDGSWVMHKSVWIIYEKMFMFYGKEATPANTILRCETLRDMLKK